MKKQNNKVRKGLDVLILVTSVIIISALLVVGYFGLKGLLLFITTAISLEGALLYAALLLGMVGGIMYLLEMWINAVDKAWKSLRLRQVTE